MNKWIYFILVLYMSKLKKHLEGFISKGLDDNTGGHSASIYQKKAKKEPFKEEHSLRVEKDWFLKTAYSPTEPLELEVISGEIYRLWIGNTQPKTRLVTDGVKNPLIASEGVPGFKSFKSMLETGDKITNHKNFARILVSSLVLAETDLKADNIGTNANHDVVKIDHDSSLWPIVGKIIGVNNDQNKTNFTFEDLDNILQPRNYKVSAWAGGLGKEVKDEINNSIEFRTEVYAQILKILSSPAKVLSAIQDLNAPKDPVLKVELANFIQERLNLLKQEALKSKGFRDFISNLDIEKYTPTLQNEFNNFLTSNNAYASNQNSEEPLTSPSEIKAVVANLNKIDLLKEQLKLDPQNAKHLEYWQNQTTHIKGFKGLSAGGTSVTLNNTTYKVPSRIAQMMALTTTDFSSYKEYKDEINKIRTPSTKDTFQIFKAFKTELTRNKATQLFYEADNVEELNLSDSNGFKR